MQQNLFVKANFLKKSLVHSRGSKHFPSFFWDFFENKLPQIFFSNKNSVSFSTPVVNILYCCHKSLKFGQYLDYLDYRVTTLREKCPCWEFFWSVFSCIWTEYGEILSISPYSVRMGENTGHKNYEYGHFLRRASDNGFIMIWLLPCLTEISWDTNFASFLTLIFFSVHSNAFFKESGCSKTDGINIYICFQMIKNVSLKLKHFDQDGELFFKIIKNCWKIGDLSEILILIKTFVNGSWQITNIPMSNFTLYYN